MRIVLFTFLAQLFLAVSLLSAQEPTIQLTACGHHDYPPWNWQKENRIIGACAEITQRLFNKVNARVDLTYVGPWARCQEMIRKGQVDINICSFSNSARRQYSDFIETPIGFNEQAFFVKRGTEFPLERWEDLKGKTIGMVIGVSIGPEFDSFLEENTRVDAVPNFRSNFRKLALGRIDGIPVGRHTGRSLIRSYGLSQDIVDLPTPLLRGTLYISMSKLSPHRNLLPRVEKLMQQTWYLDLVETLLEKYSYVYALEHFSRDQIKLDRIQGELPQQKVLP